MISQQEIIQYIREAKNGKLSHFEDEKQAIAFALNCIDLTSLESTDTDTKIENLCRQALRYRPQTAGVCVYPVFVKSAKTALKDSPIKVVSVAGGFPSGQSPLSAKLEEVKYALDRDADEIDTVFPQGLFFEKKYDLISRQIKEIKDLCGDKKLKVILETGQLQSVENIIKASSLAIEAGADFIKTSTGKTAVNSTPEAFVSMLWVIKLHYEKTGKQIGVKPAGGIQDVETTLLYIKLLEKTAGEKWLTNNYFRIGASRLAEHLANFLQ
ncbi:MAG: deoxyribose-phosphate aldolase [Bacteroidales bacterium]|jgi:deoxyribose-phosphate aldolase|nr:deoxyribose-phosphate aldolase [Bacteroidales bacterium]